MKFSATFAFATVLLAGAAHAQTAPAAPPAATPPVADAPATTPPAAVAQAPDAAAKPDALVVLFDLGSAKIRAQDAAVLDKASRMYTDGKPTVMILTGSTDKVGQPLQNIRLSQARALAVLNQLVARGIPAERFQLLAKGESELPVAASGTGAEPRDRRVEIAWR